MGGLPEKGFKLRRISEENEGRTLKIDSGNLFFKNGGSYHDNAPETIQAGAIAEIYTALDYDAVAVGADDLSAGIDFLRTARDNGLNLLSANIYDGKGRHIFRPYRKRAVGSLTIAIVGITGPRLTAAADYHIGDPVAELTRLVSELEEESDLIVLLSSLNVQETIALVEPFPAIRIGISADRSKGNVGPVTAGKGFIVQTGGRGQYLGSLKIVYNGGPWRPASVPAQQDLLAAAESRFSTYRCDFLKVQQSGGSDAQIRSIIDQSKRQIRTGKRK